MFFIKSDKLVTNMSAINYNKHRPFILLLQFVLRGSIIFIAELLMVKEFYAPIKQHVAGPSCRAV
jgi:hypothetical protein